VDVLPVSYAFSFRIRKSLPQTGEDAASCVDLAEAFPGDAEVAFGFAAAFGGWVADGGSDEAFALQPLQGRIDAANGNVAAAMAFELAGDRHAVGLVAEMDDGEQNHEFEFPEIAAVCHYFNNSEEIDDVKSNLYLSRCGLFTQVVRTFNCQNVRFAAADNLLATSSRIQPASSRR